MIRTPSYYPQRQRLAPTLGRIGKNQPKPRSYRVHNRMPQRLTAACQAGKCYDCFSQNCSHECHKVKP